MLNQLAHNAVVLLGKEHAAIDGTARELQFSKLPLGPANVILRHVADPGLPLEHGVLLQPANGAR